MNTTLSLSKSSLFASACAVGALFFIAQPSHAQLVLNGDFESVNGGAEPIQTFPEWSEGSEGTASDASNPLSGSHSAYMNTGNSTMLQNLSNFSIDEGVASTFTDQFILSMDFAMTDPGDSGDRGLHVNFGEISTGTFNNAEFGNVNLRVNGEGDVQVYNINNGPDFADGWYTILSGEVDFSTSLDTPVVNNLSISGQFNGNDASYSVTVNNGTSSGPHTYFQNGNGTRAGSFDRIQFETQYTQGDYVVDNVSVSVIPEPSALALFAGSIGLMMIFLRRRRA